MRTFKISLSIFLSIILTGHISWAQSWVELGSVPNSGRYDDVHFVNDTLGFTANSSGQIFKTTNAGMNWELVHSSGEYFRAIDFLDEQTGFAGTLSNTLLMTEDGGETWMDIANRVPQSFDGICGLSHVNDEVFGVGIFANPAYFIKSTDRGVTWTFKDMSAFADGLVECHFVTEEVGYVGGIIESTGSVILKTMDGGENWATVFSSNSGSSDYVWKIDFVSENVVYASIETFFGNTTDIVKSVNGGDTWEILNVANQQLDIQGIGFLDELTGWVGPRDSPLYKTIDGGLTWVPKVGSPNNVNRIIRVGQDRMIASGSKIYEFGVDTSIEHELTSLHHKIRKVFPNPASETLTIEIEIENRTHLVLDLFNMTGAHIYSFYNDDILAGEHEFKIDHLSHLKLTSGAYMVFMRTNESFQSIEVVIQQAK